jgi:uncharacterized protein
VDHRTPRPRPLSAARVALVGAVAFGLFAVATVVDGRDGGAKAVEANGAPDTTTATPGPASVVVTTDPVPAPTTTAATVAPKQPGVPRVYTAGDSTAGGLGVSMQPLLDDMGTEQQLDYKNSTGLTRPDFYDWPARLQSQVKALDPDVVVVMFGGNDAQPIELADGTKVNVDKPEWATEYGRRVGAAMDFLQQDGRKVIWVGVTSAKSESFNDRLQVLHAVLVAQAAAHPDVTFVDTWPMFQSPDGKFADYVVDDDGVAKSMRSKEDGFHLNPTGAKHLARAVAVKVAEATGKPAPTPVANPHASDGVIGIYKVEAGDAWGLVAQRLGLGLSVLLETNGATAATPLYVGDELKIPTPIVAPEVLGPAVTQPATSTG